jgi:hypothetical protein
MPEAEGRKAERAQSLLSLLYAIAVVPLSARAALLPGRIRSPRPRSLAPLLGGWALLEGWEC